MKSRDELLADYVRKKFPNIEKSFEFTLYQVGETIKELGRVFTKHEGVNEDEFEDIHE